MNNEKFPACASCSFTMAIIILRFDLDYSLKKNNFIGLGPDFRTGEFSSLDRYKIEFMMLLLHIILHFSGSTFTRQIDLKTKRCIYVPLIGCTSQPDQ